MPCPHVTDLLAEGVEIQALALERAPEHGQLVQHAAQGPNVALPPVASAAEHLRRHVQRRADLPYDVPVRWMK